MFRSYADPEIMKTEEFEIDEVTVTLQWSNESSYIVSVSPYLPFMPSGIAGSLLRVSYNTLYNVSVLSIDPCGQNIVFEIYYGELNNFILVERNILLN